MDAIMHRTERFTDLPAPWEVLTGGGGPPLLFLHGEEGQHGWLPHHSALAEKFHVAAPTMPGLAGSGRPTWVDTVPSLAKTYLALLDRMGWKQCILAGASLGGWIAAEMASMEPARFKALVLIGAQGFPTGAYDVPNIFLTPYRRYISFGYADPNGAAFRDMWGEAPTEDAAEHDLEVMEMAALVGFKPYMHDRSLSGSLARFSNPALLLWGEEDRLTPRPAALAFKEALPDAHLALVPGAGHYVHLEQPESCAAAIKDFITERVR